MRLIWSLLTIMIKMLTRDPLSSERLGTTFVLCVHFWNILSKIGFLTFYEIILHSKRYKMYEIFLSIITRKVDNIS